MRHFFLWMSLAIVFGGIVHIAAMLVIPTLAPQSAFSRFEATMQSNIAKVLPPVTAEQSAFPFASPDVTYVLCRYDVSTTAVRFTAPTEHLYWSIGIYEPDGGNYFHLNSMQATGETTDIVLLGRGNEADLGDGVTITRATHPNGLIILRLFMRDRTMVKNLAERAAGARCSAFELEEPIDGDGDLPGPEDAKTTNLDSGKKAPAG